MKRLAIVLYGDHGGELDSLPFEIADGDTTPEETIKRALRECVDRWSFCKGDSIRIERN